MRLEIPNVQFCPGDSNPLDITVVNDIIHSVRRSSSSSAPWLLLPPLCHPHIHLDKPYILTCNHPQTARYPDYSDLAPRTGSFEEALQNTSKAKERYTRKDLYLRGSQLLATSYNHGVTSVRAFVEIDHVVGTKPLDTAIRLKRDFAPWLEVQICLFAQDPLFSEPHGEENRRVLSDALKKDEFRGEIGALGTTPYVENGREASLQNIEWAIGAAMAIGAHLDFHLDYNLDDMYPADPGRPPAAAAQPLALAAVDILSQRAWPRDKTVVFGHCTQLTQLEARDLHGLADRIAEHALPVHFVGLPTSDLFMMGRPPPAGPGKAGEVARDRPHARPRGTLQVPSLIRDFGLRACLGVNNVGNAFTPYGTGDPLQLASWGVGLYHAGTVDDAELLYGCVSWRARQAIGLGVDGDEDSRDTYVSVGQKWRPRLMVRNPAEIRLPGLGEPGSGEDEDLVVPARPRLGVKDVVWDPPEVDLRSIM